MPNGHGGSPRFFSALILLVCLIIVYSFLMKGASPWLAWVGYPMAALFGWRFAYGLHMRKVTEYDGAYTSDDAWTKAFVKYIAGSVVYGIAAMALWHFLISR